jgi:hypothetical protein
MKMPSWITRQASTSAEHAERVEDARRDIATLTAEKTAAQVAFDAAPNAKAEDGLLAADEALRRGQLRLESAERALAGAKADEAAKARAALLARKSELLAGLSPHALREQRAPGVEEEVRAVLAVVDVHARRTQLEQELLTRDNELSRVQAQLGEATSSNIISGIDPNRVAVASALADHLHSLDDDDLAKPFLQHLLFNAYGGIPYGWTAPGHISRQSAQ